MGGSWITEIGKENKKIKRHKAAYLSHCSKGLGGLSGAHGRKTAHSQHFLFPLITSHKHISTEDRSSYDHFLVTTHLPLEGSVQLHGHRVQHSVPSNSRHVGLSGAPSLGALFCKARTRAESVHGANSSCILAWLQTLFLPASLVQLVTSLNADDRDSCSRKLSLIPNSLSHVILMKLPPLSWSPSWNYCKVPRTGAHASLAEHSKCSVK